MCFRKSATGQLNRGLQALKGSLLVPFVVLYLGGATFAAPEVVSVRLDEGLTIREIAADRLGDADLWDEILKETGIESITDLKPGMILKVPVGKVRAADEALKKSLEVITEATRNGAKIFTPELITEAIRLREQALERRKGRDWQQASSLATSALTPAQSALDRSLSLRKVAAQAILSDRQGTVQGRRSSDLVWVEAPVGSVLVEQQRVRTLSDSLAEILFTDESRLRMNENSNAVIQRMQKDQLTRQEETSVSILAGDVYGLLGGTGARKSFTVESKGLKAKVDSLNFWASQEGDTTRFANYDTGTIEVESAGAKTTLGQGQGTLVRALQAPTPARQLLKAPELSYPSLEQTIYEGGVVLQWAPVPAASSYWVEVARDADYRSIVSSRRGLKETSFRTGEMDSEVYFWRVSAVDDEGFPGTPSASGKFEIRKDANAPYLALESPREGSISRTAELKVIGVADYGTSVVVNGRPAVLNGDGRFELTVDLQPGTNEVVVEVRDPAGNRTVRRRRVVFVPDEPAEVQFSPDLRKIASGQFLSLADQFTVKGETVPDARIEVIPEGSGHGLTAYSDERGGFQFSIPTAVGVSRFDLEVYSKSGFVSQSQFSVVRDDSDPAVQILEIPPRVTSADRVRVAGILRDSVTLEINGSPVQVVDRHFDTEVSLKPGLNELVLVAIDRGGVRSTLTTTVVRDQEPPQALRNRITTRKVGNGSRIEVQVWVQDLSSVKRVGRFSLVAGSEVLNGYLTLSEDGKSYQGAVDVIGDPQGRASLLSIELEDYSGNRRLYSFR